GELLRELYGLKFVSSSMFCAEKIMMAAFKKEFVDTNKPCLRCGKPASDDGHQEHPHNGSVIDHYYVNTVGKDYPSIQACYEDRGNHRAFWFDRISDYCRADPSRLGREIFMENDVYCGIRSAEEFHACKNAGLFDYSIFVDAYRRLG